MPRLLFRLSGRTRPLSEWLALLLPAVDRSTRRHWVEQGRVRVDEVVVDRPGANCRPGARVELDVIEDVGLSALPGEASEQWFVWVDDPAWFGGTLELEGPDGQTDDSGTLEFVVEERTGGLALLAIEGPASHADSVRRALARAGMPVVGDLLAGGWARSGGVAIAPTREALASIRDVFASEDPPWPEASVGAENESLVLRVSEESSRALERGHPWVLPDEASESASPFRPGSPLRIENRGGRVLGWGWAEGDSRLSARMSEFGNVEETAIASIESRIARALARRRTLFATSAAGMPGRTDCFRLIHGEGDGLPGLFVDRLGPLLRVLVTGRASDGFRERALDALRAQLPTTPEGVEWSVLELLHLRGTGHGGSFDRVRWIAGGLDELRDAGAEAVGEGFWVEEAGLRFSVDPGWDSPRRTRPGFGLFPDQRDNRERLGPIAARGGRWLNLFAHTGAFTAALLAAGADGVVSVDLSGPYLDRLAANLEANRDRGVDPARHRSIRGEGRRIVESLDRGDRFAGIVLDPPTAAAAGRRFWSVRQDLEPLLKECLARLAAGGSLLVTQNGRGTTLGLDRILERAAAAASRRVRSLVASPPAGDHPALPGFPEGDAFEGWRLDLE